MQAATRALDWPVLFLFGKGDIASARCFADLAVKAAEKVQDADLMARARLVAAWVALSVGQPAEARQHLGAIPEARRQAASLRADAVMVERAATELETLMWDGQFAVRSVGESRPGLMDEMEETERAFLEAMAGAPDGSRERLRAEDIAWTGLNSVVLAQAARGLSPDDREGQQKILAGMSASYAKRLVSDGRDPGPRARAILELIRARLAFRMGLREEGRAALEEARRWFEAAEDRTGEAVATLFEVDGVLGAVAGTEAGDIPQAHRGPDEVQRESAGYAVTLWSSLSDEDIERVKRLLTRVVEENTRGRASGRLLAAVSLRRGFLALRVHDYLLADREYRQASEGYCRMGDTLGAAVVAWHRLILAVFVGDQIAAYRWSDRLVRWATETGMVGTLEGMASALVLLARELRSRWDHALALAALDISSRMVRSLGAPFTEVLLIRDVLEVYADLGAGDRVVEVARYALDRLDEAQRRLGSGSRSRHSFGLKPEQIEMQRITVNQMMATSLLVDVEEPRVSREFQDAVRRMRESGMRAGPPFSRMIPPLADHLETLALVVRGRFEEAEARARRLEDPSLLATVLMGSRRMEDAFQAAVKAVLEASGSSDDSLAPLEQMDMASRLWTLAVLALETGRADEATKALDRWASLPSTWRERTRRPWELETMRGWAASVAGRHDEAMALLHNALDMARRHQETWPAEREQIGAAAHVREPIAFLVGLLLGDADGTKDVSGPDMEEAFSLTEEAKGRVLLTLLEGVGPRGPLETTPDEEAEGRRLRDEMGRLASALYGLPQWGPTGEEVTRLQVELRRVQTEYEQWKNRVVARNHSRAGRLGGGRPVALREAVELARDLDAAILSFLVTRDRTYVWIVTPRGALLESSGIPRREIEERVRRLRRGLEDERWRRGIVVPYDEEASSWLFEHLIRPVYEMVKVQPMVYVIPDGVLNGVPFQVLVTDRDPVAGPKYLLDDVAVAYAPSIQTLLALTRDRATPSGNVRVLAMGNPDTGNLREEPALLRAGLGPLPEADEEVKKVREAWRGREVEVYRGAAASEDRFRRSSPEADVIHLAAHGVFDPLSPMRSAVLLARVPGSVDDGVLEAREVAELRLRSPIVVLSSCVTALGKVAAGEGAVGLSRAFLGAGARSVVSAQWSVDSRSSALLMAEFHRRLASGLSVPQALREASLRLRATGGPSGIYEHPFFFAPFIVIGGP